MNNPMKTYTKFLLQLRDNQIAFVTVAPQTLAEFMKTTWNNEEKVGYFDNGYGEGRSLAIPYHAVISVHPEEGLDTPSDSPTA